MIWIWAGLSVALIIIEAVTVQLVTVWFAVGSICAAISCLLGANELWQFIIFVAVSLLVLVLTRPYVKKIVEKKAVPTNADRVIGSDAVVSEEINNKAGVGQVKVGGVAWSARSENDDIIEVGSLVEVKKIEGVKVIVDKKG